MSLRNSLRQIDPDRFQAAALDLILESLCPEQAVQKTLRRANEYPAFAEVIKILKLTLKDHSIDSHEVARAEGMKIIFETLITIAEGDDAEKSM